MDEIKVSQLDAVDEIKDTDQIMLVTGGANKKVLGNYINEHGVKIGSSEPDTTQKVWFKKSKNLMSSAIEQGTYNNSGVRDTSTINYRNATSITVQPNTTYTFSINGVSQKYAVYYYNSSMTFISAEGLETGTFTTPANCYYLNFRCFNADYTSDYANLKIQLELGNTATSYEPYVIPSINVDGEEIYNQNVMNYSTIKEIVTQTGNPWTMIKYENGLMIGFCTKLFTGVVINTAWGSLYASQNLAFDEYPVAFTDRPTTNITQVANSSCFILNWETTENTKDQLGGFRAFRPEGSTTSRPVSLSAISIGYWK